MRVPLRTLTPRQWSSRVDIAPWPLSRCMDCRAGWRVSLLSTTEDTTTRAPATCQGGPGWDYKGNIVMPKSSPKSKSQIRVPNPKSKVQRKGPGTGADTIILQATTPLHPPITVLTWNVNPVMGKDHPWPSLTFLDLPWPSMTFYDLLWPFITF